MHVMSFLAAIPFLLASTLLAQGNVDSKFKGTAKEYSVTLNINAPNAAIMDHDFFVGHGGDRIDSAAGVHIYTISAQGYIPRLVYVQQPKSILALTREVTLAPLPNNGYELELDYRQAKDFPPTKKLETLNSLCGDFAAAGLSYPENIAVPCNRRTIIDDVKEMGGEAVFLQAQGDPADTAATSLLGRLDHAADDDFYWAAEELFAAKAGNQLAGNLVAYSAMRRQNCSRVMEIAMETGPAKTPNNGLTIIRGLCLELAGKADKAVPIYQTMLPATPHPSIGLYYQVARATRTVNAELAAKTLQTCIDKFPHAYTCYEGLAQVRALNKQQQGGILTLYSYHKAAAIAIRALFGKQPLRLDSKLVSNAAMLRPHNFELAAAALALGVGVPGAMAQATLISDLPSLKALLPMLDKSTPSDTTVSAYQVVAKGYPKEPIYWLKLAGLLSRMGRCDESVRAAEHAQSMISDADRHAALLVTKASCLVRLGRYKEAQRDLSGVLASGHDSWQAHYNMGIIHERLGANADAVQEYNLALQGSLPDSVRAQVEQRLNYVSHAKESKVAH